jgi:hypothetical protein
MENNNKPNNYIKLKVRMFDTPGEEIFHKDTPLHQVVSYLNAMCNSVVITDLSFTTKEPRNILPKEDNL